MRNNDAQFDEVLDGYLQNPGVAEVQGQDEVLNSPSHYDCLHFSEVVYEKDPRHCNHKGWRCLDVTPDNGHGYKGAAYINHDTKHIIIAHCGTRFHLAANLKSDLDILFKNIPSGFDTAKEFSLKIKNMQRRKYADYILMHTGHSLGGVHAQLCAFVDNLNAVTFDNPGCREIIENHLNVLGRKELPNKQNFIEYLSAPHFVNTCGSHIGKIYRVYVPHVNLEGHSISSLKFYGDISLTLLGAASFFVAPQVKAANLARSIGLVLGYLSISNIKEDISFENFIKIIHPDLTHIQRLHAAENIKKCFDINIGYPYLYAEMENWPSLNDLFKAKPYQASQRLFNAIKNDFRPNPKRHRANMEIEARLGQINNYTHPQHFSIINVNGIVEDMSVDYELYIFKACHLCKTFFSNNEDERYNHLLNTLCQRTNTQVDVIPNTDCDISLESYLYDDETEKDYHRAANKGTCGCFSAFFKSPVPKKPLSEQLHARAEELRREQEENNRNQLEPPTGTALN